MATSGSWCTCGNCLREREPAGASAAGGMAMSLLGLLVRRASAHACVVPVDAPQREEPPSPAGRDGPAARAGEARGPLPGGDPPRDTGPGACP